MDISSIGSTYGFAPYTTPLNGGPTVTQQVQQTDQTQQLRAGEEQAETVRQQARENENTETTGGGNVTATRGQNLNITV